MSARLDMGDAGPGGGRGDDEAVALFCVAAADDLRLLAALHDRELDEERLMALWQDGYEDFLGLRLVGEPGRRALALLREGLTDIPASVSPASLDRLAADYANIYLTYGLRASPYESVWLDEESLVMQAPMFDVRAEYARHGLVVPDWRERNDDHLVHQLQFLAHLLAPGDGKGAELAEVAGFLDDHLLLWIDRFAERVARRCETRFYAGLALLTAAWLDELREILVDLAQVPRLTAEEIEVRQRPRPASSVEVPPPSAFVPGSGPVW